MTKLGLSFHSNDKKYIANKITNKLLLVLACVREATESFSHCHELSRNALNAKYPEISKKILDYNNNKLPDDTTASIWS